jgi:hypothetical protein
MSRSLRRATAGAESMQNLVGTARCTVRTSQRDVPTYAPRLKINRYSNNRIMAPMTDMIHPAM